MLLCLGAETDCAAAGIKGMSSRMREQPDHNWVLARPSPSGDQPPETESNNMQLNELNSFLLNTALRGSMGEKSGDYRIRSPILSEFK